MSLMDNFYNLSGNPLDDVTWEKRTAEISGDNGEVIFKQEDVLVPDFWSQNALNIVASKYFTGSLGSTDRESSVRTLIERVVNTITGWGSSAGYFRTDEERLNFGRSLSYILVNQIASFNSPVWFNVGVWDEPQCSACFINSVEDSMESIMDLATREAKLFKWGSGTGSNLSTLRSSKELVSGGGEASGPVSFMRGYDSFANVIKSGGRSRRSAKLIALNHDHPDVLEFISCKADEEQKAWALIDAGYDGSLNGEAYQSIQFQNANHSVRVTDEFMEKALADEDYQTRAVTTGVAIDTLNAKDVLHAMAEATHVCGDPGLQFDDTINEWHTSKASGKINASNPCCFVGETEVITSKGKVRIDELAEMEQLPWACTHDPETDLADVSRMTKAWMSGYTTQLVEVTTKLGLTLRCTPEHVFYSGDTEIMAQDLTVGTSLHAVEFTRLLSDVDTVASVRAFECEPTPVYDIEVEDVHRFAVSSPGADHGVIVHNSEFVYLDDTACNLSSINLLKFHDSETGSFDVDQYAFVCRTMITAQEIMVSNASYPSDLIAQNSEDFRPLGLGYANLGALLMINGLPYDSDEGRNLAGLLTSIMTAAAYYQSAKLAEIKGAFNGYAVNAEHMLEVIDMHKEAALLLSGWVSPTGLMNDLALKSNSLWLSAKAEGVHHGYRNAQVTVLAPTGTISFMMDCDTTGVEPDIALIKYKNLAGGGYLPIVNQSVPTALRNLGYTEVQIEEIMSEIENDGHIENSMVLQSDHLAVFDCAFQSPNGSRSIAPEGHVKMLGAVQPFLSGAVSKTVNVPSDATAQDIVDMYTLAWRVGAKAIAVYRDGSKRIQPLIAGDKGDNEEVTDLVISNVSPPVYNRTRLGDTRNSKTHRFAIGGLDGYITVGEYANGQPGEVFITLAKQGSIASGLLDAVGVLTSISLQSGVPLDVLYNKFKDTRFEPSGFTGNTEIPMVSSVLDYVFRWIHLEYGEIDESDTPQVYIAPTLVEAHTPDTKPGLEYSGDICLDCGGMAVRSGSCSTCTRCGSNTGCG